MSIFIALLIPIILGTAPKHAIQETFPVPPTLKVLNFIERTPLLKAKPSGSTTVTHVRGTIRIDEEKKVVSEDVTVTLEYFSGQDVSFEDSIGIQSVELEDGTPVTFRKVPSPYGFPLIRIPAKALPLQSPVTLRIRAQFSLSGRWSMTSRVIGNFGNITYLGGVILPMASSLDTFTTDLWIEVPAGRVATASGETIEVQLGDDGWDRYHVVSNEIMDSYAIVVGNLYEWRTNNKDHIIEAYLNPTLYKSSGNDILQLVRDVVDFYEKRYGPVLFSKVGLAEIPNEVGAGLGWPGLVWLPDMMLMQGGPDGRIHYVAHELGHQWFPDTIKNDDLFAPWLSEGFAEYSSISYVGHVLGEEWAAFFRDYYGLLFQHLSDMDRDYPLTSLSAAQPPDWTTHMIVTYFKGSVVVRTLQEVVGDEHFFGAIKKLNKDNAGRRSFYNTEGLQRYLERESGMDLSEYFKEWVYRSAYPTYLVEMRRFKRKDGWLVRVHVEADSSDRRVKFVMPVVLRVMGVKGESVDRRVTITNGSHDFDVEVDFEPSRVLFDPKYTFIKRLGVLLAPDVDLSGRVDARDLALVAAGVGASIKTNPLAVERYDCNNDRRVDEKDIEAVLANFGAVW